MKLNEKGLELYCKWHDIYKKALALEIEDKGEENAEYGWSIIEDWGFVNNIEDMVGLAIYGDDDFAIYNIYNNYLKGEEYAYGVTADEMIEKLKPYFYIFEDEKEYLTLRETRSREE